MNLTSPGPACLSLPSLFSCLATMGFSMSLLSTLYLLLLLDLRKPMMEDTFLCFFSLNSQVASGASFPGYTPASQEAHGTFPRQGRGGSLDRRAHRMALQSTGLLGFTFKTHITIQGW